MKKLFKKLVCAIRGHKWATFCTTPVSHICKRCGLDDQEAK
jgi:hypothetical protein